MENISCIYGNSTDNKNDFCPIEVTGPTKPHDRIVEIDILRGFAVLGMIVWNFRSLSMGNYYKAGNINYVVYWIISVLDVENTVHLIFAFLFGWGLAKQMRFHATSVTFARRLLVLFIIGIVHSVLWYRPDFLHIYAMLGVALILFSNQSNAIILASAVVIIGMPVLGEIILGKFISHETYYDQGVYNSLGAQTILFSTYSDMVLMRVHEFIREYTHPHAYIRDFDILGMFLFGLFAVRRGIFENISRSSDLIWRILWCSLIARLLGLGWILALGHLKAGGTGDSFWLSGIYQLLSCGNRPERVEMLLLIFAKHALSLFYICLIVLFLQINTWKNYFLPVANVGRLALSNYLLHSLVGTTIFYGYGLALYGKIGCALGEAIAVAVFCCQMAMSTWWLSRFQFGPVEWLWRSLSHWQFQSMRVN